MNARELPALAGGIAAIVVIVLGALAPNVLFIAAGAILLLAIVQAVCCANFLLCTVVGGVTRLLGFTAFADRCRARRARAAAKLRHRIRLG